MKDYSDPDLDGALIAAIHHECFLMKASHDEFIRLGEKQILAHLSPTEQVQLFSSYSSFLHHLYEFYVACFMRDQGTDKGFSGIPGAMKKDALFQGEAKRVFSSIVHRLRSGKGQGWENDIEDYDVEIHRILALNSERSGIALHMRSQTAPQERSTSQISMRTTINMPMSFSVQLSCIGVDTRSTNLI
ncbi:hypothetical protein [Pseudomonas fulva]|uniref:hypothetical protein n=1 Tax=Pseudomonas fulva TaxID=47880 RepID=UPI003818EAEA